MCDCYHLLLFLCAAKRVMYVTSKRHRGSRVRREIGRAFRESACSTDDEVRCDALPLETDVFQGA
jgi:hypothetical protein